MHNVISVAVGTRDRYTCLKKFVDSFAHTTHRINRPQLTLLHDAPEEILELEDFQKSLEDMWEGDNRTIWSPYGPSILQNIIIPSKSSLTELWNWCVMLAPTDWVLICNDDVTFNKGWLEYLEQQIATDKYDMIHLFHYGGMCIHKRLILKCGWFDETFRGGGFEDIDYQLRLSEAGLKDRIDRSHDFIRKEGKVEIGHFMNHHRDVQANGSWSGENNADWMCQKWKRKSPYNYSIPSFRTDWEWDWHPTYTRKYEKKYGFDMEFPLIGSKSINASKEIYL